MRRGVCALLLALLSSVGATNASAASDVAVQHASNGSVVVVGNGFRPDSELVVGVGEANFPAYVDSAGAFEVNTGLVEFHGDLAIHRQQPALAFARLPDTSPHPLAVVFAQGLTSSLEVFALSAGSLALAWLALRRYPRP